MTNKLESLIVHASIYLCSLLTALIKPTCRFITSWAYIMSD